MLSRSPSVGQVARVGVGIDTSRYGHYAAFLRDDLQPAAADGVGVSWSLAATH